MSLTAKTRVMSAPNRQHDQYDVQRGDGGCYQACGESSRSAVDQVAHDAPGQAQEKWTSSDTSTE
ncbi:hypothetical protein GCM10029976_075100 [Kribbella albertanoniae]